MRRGEITGTFFDVTKEDMGMPIRSITVLKRNERKNISPMDNIVSVEDRNMDGTTTHEQFSFDYFDPSTTHYSGDTTVETKGKQKMNFDDPRLDFDVNHRSMPSTRNERSIDTIQNISSLNIDFINTLSCKIFDNIANNTCVNFCVFPIGIMATLIENDQNIKKILSIINTSEIFHQIKTDPKNRTIFSRMSMIISLQTSKLINSFGYYDDNENHVVDFPLNDPNFAIGFISNKKGNTPNISHKIFTGYTMNLKHAKVNIYCPAFKISNRLNLNNTLKEMEYISNNSTNYLQTVYLESKNNIYIKSTTMQETFDLSENFIFYVRYIPNNVILFLGRNGEL